MQHFILYLNKNKNSKNIIILKLNIKNYTCINFNLKYEIIYSNYNIVYFCQFYCI